LGSAQRQLADFDLQRLLCTGVICYSAVVYQVPGSSNYSQTHKLNSLDAFILEIDVLMMFDHKTSSSLRVFLFDHPSKVDPAGG